MALWKNAEIQLKLAKHSKARSHSHSELKMGVFPSIRYRQLDNTKTRRTSRNFRLWVDRLLRRSQANSLHHRNAWKRKALRRETLEIIEMRQNNFEVHLSLSSVRETRMPKTKTKIVARRELKLMWIAIEQKTWSFLVKLMKEQLHFGIKIKTLNDVGENRVKKFKFVGCEAWKQLKWSRMEARLQCSRKSWWNVSCEEKFGTN